MSFKKHVVHFEHDLAYLKMNKTVGQPFEPHELGLQTMEYYAKLSCNYAKMKSEYLLKHTSMLKYRHEHCIIPSFINNVNFDKLVNYPPSKERWASKEQSND